MNMQTRTLLAALAFASVPAGALAEDEKATTPNCDAMHARIDGVEGRTSIDSNIDFKGDDLVFREDGDVRMIMTEDHELFIDGERIALDARGEELVGRYYETFEGVIDSAMDIAGDAAGLGVSAAIEALVAVFTGDDEMDAFEARMEEKARGFEARADALCAQLRGIEEIERELDRLVPAFEPQMFRQERIVVQQ